MKTQQNAETTKIGTKRWEALALLHLVPTQGPQRRPNDEFLGVN